MTNKEIAKIFQFLAKIMELHGENSFKTKSYTNAYMTIRKLAEPLSNMASDKRSSIPGFGKTIINTIEELLTTGEIATLEKYKAITPEGIQKMLTIKGLGPKKVKVIWDELDICTPGELLYACNENRLTSVKGFGAKTQETLKNQLLYFLDSQGKTHYATAEDIAIQLIELLNRKFPKCKHELTGSIRRQNIIIEQIDILTSADKQQVLELLSETYDRFEMHESNYTFDTIAIHIEEVEALQFVKKKFLTTGPVEYVDQFDLSGETYISEQDIYERNNRTYLAPYLRDHIEIVDDKGFIGSDIIQIRDIKGVIHNHSTWSDGIHTIKEMANKAISLGYEYLLMTDHSQSAFYANGLSTDRVLAQMEEIDELNESLEDFVVYKGIESDILSNGALDYDDEILELFDVVIASVHSNLRMDKEKATNRLLAAIENPFTHILGHPTGRLLLSREGYPLDFDRIIEACAYHDVVIELNANPHRLDIDWTLIQKAMKAGVMISINPDAHSTAGIEDIRYGVLAAQKGGLKTSMCLNTKKLDDFQIWVDSLKY